ncbi:hypothetical protein [Neptunicella marina]|uniref:Uncharacterized protein n=1 Tax=Neptunicella marina TaxID=2125989 RepID=A0A8J6M1X9_9ALTE|nr:hypothetical protein [Neptunicella marina]MBC3765923.1 hypothetical protein [Neptunicella marina]
MNNKKIMIVLAIVFILPVALAKLALELDWFNRAATNKGELLEPVLDATPLYSKTKPPTIWRLVYVIPEQCDQSCKNAIYSIHQVWLALGRESDRVQALLITTEQSDPTINNDIKQLDNIHQLQTSTQNIQNVFKQSSADGIFVVDTLQNIILRYGLQQQKQKAVMHSRDILADVKKLLKLSRIG